MHQVLIIKKVDCEANQCIQTCLLNAKYLLNLSLGTTGTININVH